MASGRADYFSGVDVAYQALSQLIVRPKYGGAVQTAGQTVVFGDSLNVLTTISGRGMVYGCSVWLDHTLTHANSEVWLAIDSEFLSGISFLRLRDYGFVQPRSSIISLNLYDSTNYIYSVGVSYGLTFENELILGYQESHNTSPTVHYILVYALI